MSYIIGLVVTLACVCTGYLLAGGKFAVIMHALPYEMTMIMGAGAGSVIAAAGLKTCMPLISLVIKALTGDPYSKKNIRTVLAVLYMSFNKLELSKGDFDTFVEENGFKQHKGSASFPPKTLFGNGARRILGMATKSFQSEAERGRVIANIIKNETKVYVDYAGYVTQLADSLPAIGIVAAVLGIIKTMSSIDKPPEVLGGMIGSALVGTFLGVFLAYCVVQPLAGAINKYLKGETNVLYAFCTALEDFAKHRNAQGAIDLFLYNMPSSVKFSIEEIIEIRQEVQDI